MTFPGHAGRRDDVPAEGLQLQLVEDALVPSEAKRRFSPIDVIGPLVVLCVFVGVWNFMHYWGLEHIFHKGNFLLPPWRNILYDSFVRTIPQPDGSTVTPRNNMFQALWVTTRLMLVGRTWSPSRRCRSSSSRRSSGRSSGTRRTPG